MFYFLIGVIFVVFALPVLGGLQQLIESILQYCTIYFAAKSHKIEKSIEDDGISETNLIGFRADDDSDYLYEDDEDYDDETNKKKSAKENRKVGFN